MAAERIVHGRYRVVSCIGRGGMGAVYEAVDERLRIRVALKESFESDGELRNQFEREAHLLASLRHPALPRVTDYFIDGEHSFLIMEYVAGPTLGQVLNSQEGKPVDFAQVVKWADQVLDVLVYLHEQGRGVIHRDIKPQNIKLTEGDGICLIDFGLAKAGSDEGRSVHGFTRRYAPIEQIEDRGTTQQSDIYALGATLYHLLTGVKPADAEVRARVTVAGGADPLVSGHVLLPAIGLELSSILDKALAQCPEERFASAAEFREALRRVGRVEGGDREVCDQIPAGRSRHRHWLAVAACLVAVAIVGLLVNEGVWRKSDSAAPKVFLSGAQSSKDSTVDRSEDSKSVLAVSGGGRKQSHVRASVPPKVQKVRDAHARTESAKSVDKSPRRKQVAVLNRARPAVGNEVLHAPDGTQVVKFRDGRVRAFQSGERRR